MKIKYMINTEEKPVGKEPLGELRSGYKDDIKMALEELQSCHNFIIAFISA